MGLSITVGILAELRESGEDTSNELEVFVKINKALVKAGIPSHTEPEVVKDYWTGDMAGYSSLHFLRRIAAHLWYSNKVPPPTDGENPDDPIVDAYYRCDGAPRPSFWQEVLRIQPNKPPPFGHLMLHADAEGYYLPVDFKRVVLADKRLQIPGAGVLGSSYQLLRECDELARRLQMPLDMNPDSDELYNALNNPAAGAGWRSYGIETFVCLRLRRACQASIASGAAIVFH